MSSNKLHMWPEHIVDALIQVREAIYATHSDVCPPKELCLRAFETLAPEEVRVVILGQDPYHAPGKASGLAFAYNSGYAGSINSSMQNIVAELTVNNYPDAVMPDPREFCQLQNWVRQGVLLLNTRLTCPVERPMGHAGLGWEAVIREVIRYLSSLDRNIAQVISDNAVVLDSTIEKDYRVWLLWGTEAQKTFDSAVSCKCKRRREETPPELNAGVLRTSHPCKFSNTRGTIPFTGSRCFEKANELLLSKGRRAIRWV